MPALVLLGQPTIVSGDDIRWVCILIILLRLFQVAVVIPFLVHVVNFGSNSNSSNDNEVYTGSACIEEESFSSPLVSKARLIAISYGALTLFFALSSILLEAFIWRTSLLGTPTQPEKRDALKCLCFVKLVPGSLLRIVTMILGLVLTIILEKFCNCTNNSNSEMLRDVRGGGGQQQCGGNFYRVRLLLVILIISHLTEVCLATFIHVFILFTSSRGKYHVFQWTKWIFQSLCYCCSCCRGSRSTTPRTTTTTTTTTSRAVVSEFISNHNNHNNNMDGSGWQFFCSCCFTLTSLLTCCLLGGRQAATADFRDISMALVTFLDDGGHLDITISDVLCALVVLHKQHQERRYAYIHRIKSQILIEMSSSRENQLLHHAGIINSSRSSGNDTHTAAAAAAGVEPAGTRKLGSGRLDNDDEGDEHVVDLEVVMLTESMDHSQQQQQQRRNDADSKPVVTDNEDDLERGQPGRVPQPAVRATTLLRWTLQRDNIDNNNFNDSNTRYQREERTMLSPTDASARFAMAAGAHFMRLALAIYGPSLLPVARPCQGSLCFLGWDACCTTPCRRRRQTKNNSTAIIEMLGDNPCSCNENTLLREANLTMDDVAYATFNSSVDKNPYCIIIDRPWKSIVVAIRGSLSLESIVTDLALVPARLVTSHVGESKDQKEAQGDAVEHEKPAIADGNTSTNSQVYCHSGMLQTAQWMYKDLHRHGILDKLLLANNAPYADYRLVLTGHSLGAGLAAILGIMLRPKFPTLKCFCFAPPGCTLSDNALEATRIAAPSADIKSDGGNNNCNNTGVDTKHARNEDDFITSYAVGSDIIPRISLEAMESLRDDVLETIARIKVNKVQAMGGGTSLEVLDLLHREESIPRTEFQEQLLAFRAHQASVREANPIGIVKLHPPPGKMVHFVKTSTKSNRRLADSIRASTDSTASTSNAGHSSSYAAIWAERQDFSQIQLSASMLGNHYPWTALAIMERIATEQFGLQEPYFVPE